MSGRAWMWTALFLAACGGGAIVRHEAHTPPEGPGHESLEEEMTRLEERLEQATSLSGIDCREVCDLSARICGLADDICEIAESHPEDAHASARCEDARGRCARAGAEATARCGCRTP